MSKDIEWIVANKIHKQQYFKKYVSQLNVDEYAILKIREIDKPVK